MGDMAQEGITFCTACGRRRTGSIRFCTGCGTEFRDPEQPAMPAYAEPTVSEPAYAEAEPGYADLEPGYADGGPGYGGGGGYPGPVRRPPGGRNKVFVMAAVAVIVLGAAGGAYALVARHGHGQAAGPPTETASTAASQSQAAPTSAAPTTSAPAAPPASSGTTVTVAPAAASNPAEAQVSTLVNSYFTAINQHDYSAWASLLDPQMQQQNPESSFDSGYATTTDSSETLTSISDTGSGGLAAALTFTSQQSPSDSPDNSSCDQWSITLFLIPNGSGYLIGTPPSTYQPSHQPC